MEIRIVQLVDSVRNDREFDRNLLGMPLFHRTDRAFLTPFFLLFFLVL
jgi:hypothetical protein